MQTIDVDWKSPFGDSTLEEQYFQRWVSTLLLGPTRLTSLYAATDHAPWPPVLGLSVLRDLELHLRCVSPWLGSILADLGHCSCLETLKIADAWMRHDELPMDLPDLCMQDVATLKIVELVNWYPKKSFTLPPGCFFRFLVVLKTEDQWNQ